MTYVCAVELPIRTTTELLKVDSIFDLVLSMKPKINVEVLQ